MRVIEKNNLTFLVGQSAVENWRILSTAQKDHWWVHLDDGPSAHVIVETEVPLIAEELAFARQCILDQTPKATKTAKSIRCIYARVRDVKRGTAVGEVTVKRANHF